MATQEVVLRPTVMLAGSEKNLPALTMDEASSRYNQLLDFTKRIMKPGVDYGEIPGVQKPTLLKPGAEKLCYFFGLTPTFESIESTEDWQAGFFYYRFRCNLLRGDRLVAQAEGSCNSMEGKFRYRWVRQEQIPQGMDPAKLRTKGGKQTLFEPQFALDKRQTDGQYGKPESHWALFDAATKNGTAREASRAMGREKKLFHGLEIDVDTTLYQVPNPEIYDQVNTILKMAIKRALVAATLIGANASEYYTQDVEDMEPIDVPFTQPTPQPQQPEGKTETIGGYTIGVKPQANKLVEMPAKSAASTDEDQNVSRKTLIQIPDEITRESYVATKEAIANGRGVNNQQIDAFLLAWFRKTDRRQLPRTPEAYRAPLQALASMTDSDLDQLRKDPASLAHRLNPTQEQMEPQEATTLGQKVMAKYGYERHADLQNWLNIIGLSGAPQDEIDALIAVAIHTGSAGRLPEIAKRDGISVRECVSSLEKMYTAGRPLAEVEDSENLTKQLSDCIENWLFQG